MRAYLYYFLTPFLPAVVCFYYASGLGCSLWAQSLIILPIVAVIQYISSLRVYPEYFSALRHVPTPKKRTLLRGNLPFLAPGSPVYGLADMVNREFPQEELVRAYLVNVESIVARGPKALDEVMSQRHHDFVYPKVVPNTFDMAGIRGLFAEEGEIHKVHRKALSKWFAPHNLRRHWPQILVGARQMTEAVDSQLQTLPFPGYITTAREWVTRTTTDIAGMVLLDSAVATSQAERDTLYSSLAGCVGAVTSFYHYLFFSAVDAGLLTLIPRVMISGIVASRDRVQSAVLQAYKREKARYADRNMSSDTRKTILHPTIESSSFTHEESLEHGMTFLGAAFKTMASAVQWAILHLARHPEIQARLRREILTHLPSLTDITDDDVDSSMHTLLALPYLNAVCNEVLRINPPQAITVREAIRDTSITGVFIPKGTLIIILPHTVHYDQQLWGESAREFDPERWLQPDVSRKSKLSFMPFGYGPRQCIAQLFARQELLCLVAAFVARFEACPEDPNAPILATDDIVPAPLDGARVRLTAVTG